MGLRPSQELHILPLMLLRHRGRFRHPCQLRNEALTSHDQVPIWPSDEMTSDDEIMQNLFFLTGRERCGGGGLPLTHGVFFRARFFFSL